MRSIVALSLFLSGLASAEVFDLPPTDTDYDAPSGHTCLSLTATANDHESAPSATVCRDGPTVFRWLGPTEYEDDTPILPGELQKFTLTTCAGVGCADQTPPPIARPGPVTLIAWGGYTFEPFGELEYLHDGVGRDVPHLAGNPTDLTITATLQTIVAGPGTDQRVISQSLPGDAEQNHFVMLSLTQSRCLPRLRLRIRPAGGGDPTTRTLVGSGPCLKALDVIEATYNGSEMSLTVNGVSYGVSSRPGEIVYGDESIALALGYQPGPNDHTYPGVFTVKIR